MERIVQIARETGYLEGVQDFRPMDAMAICRLARSLRHAGARRAAGALSRIAEDQHPEVTFSAGDRVIYSAARFQATKAVSRVIIC